MTRDEAKNIVQMISAAYPNWRIPDPTMTVNMWAAVLSDYSYNHIQAATKAYILSDTSGFAPSIGELVDKIQAVHPAGVPDDMEAWALVDRAICNSNYNSQDEYDNLPPVVQKAVGSPANLREWAMMESQVVQSVIQSNFLKSYRLLREKKQTTSKLPTALRIQLGLEPKPAITTQDTAISEGGGRE